MDFFVLVPSIIINIFVNLILIKGLVIRSLKSLYPKGFQF